MYTCMYVTNDLLTLISNYTTHLFGGTQDWPLIFLAFLGQVIIPCNSLSPVQEVTIEGESTLIPSLEGDLEAEQRGQPGISIVLIWGFP